MPDSLMTIARPPTRMRPVPGRSWVLHTDRDRRARDDGVRARDLEAARDRAHRHLPVRQLLLHALHVDLARVGHAHRDVHQHAAALGAHVGEEGQARVPDRVRHRAARGLRPLLAVHVHPIPNSRTIAFALTLALLSISPCRVAQPITLPPMTRMVSPVTYEDASEARN